MFRTKDFTGKDIEFDCLSCDLVNGKVNPPGGMIYEDDTVTLAADIEVPIKGFIILAPKRHVKEFDELSTEEVCHLSVVLKHAIKALKSLKVCENVEVYFEEKHHLHIWIMPQHEWMKENNYAIKRGSKELFELAKERAKRDGIEEILETIERLKRFFADTIR